MTAARSMKRRLFLAGATALTITLAACSGGGEVSKDGKSVEFSVWKIEGDAEHVAIKVGTDGFFKASKQVLENFEAKPKLSEKQQPGDQG